MNTLHVQDGNFILKCSVREADFAKQVPGLKYKASPIDAFVGPANHTIGLVIEGVFAGRELRWTDEAIAWVAEDRERVAQLMALKSSEADNGVIVEATNGDRLFPFQANDAYFMALSRSVLDLSVLGSGKGPKALGAVRIAESMGQEVYPLLVVTRPMMLFTFAEEASKWLPGKTVQVLTKGMTPSARTKALTSGADVTIIPWHLLPLHSKLVPYVGSLTAKQKEPKELNGRFKAAIFDEAHKAAGSPITQTAQAMWAVADELQYKFFLTNTPMREAPDDLWVLLRAAYPTHYSASGRFKTRYCLMRPQFFGPDECVGLRPDTEEEFRSIFGPIHIERGEEVLPELPPKLYHDPYLVEMEGKQASAYKAIDQKVLVKVGDLVLTATDAMVKKLRLLQLACGTPVLGIGKAVDGSEQVTVEKLTMPSCKVDFLLEVLDKYTEPLIVFMDSRLLLELCAEQLTKAKISFVEFKGGMKDKIREAGRHRFQAGEVRVALCMLQVAAEGLTLTAAPRILYLQRDDSMILSTQSEGRIRRIGQMANVVEYLDCITKDTVEVSVHENYLEKEARSNQTLGRTTQQRKLAG